MSQMLKSSGAMSLATLLSRVLGLGREIVYARFMGDTWVAGAFTLAFMVPNLFRRLLGEGILTAAFIPIFKEKEKTGTEAEMWQAANAVLSGLILATGAVIGAGVLGLSWLLYLDADRAGLVRLMLLLRASFPWVAGAAAVALVILLGRGEPRRPAGPAARLGLALGGTLSGLFLLLLGGVTGGVWIESGDGQTLLMLRLLRVMFPYVLLVCVAAVFMGMLNARGHFFIPALGATLLNVVMIASVLLLAPRLGERLEQQVFGLAIGVVLAGLAQSLFQVPLLHREGYRLRWLNPWPDPTVHRVVRQMIPGAVGVAAFHLNVLITQGFAFSIDGGVVASFNYAVRLMELPQGLFGVSLATYLLPTLSGLAAEKKYPEFRTTLAQGAGWLTFVNLLASVLLVVLAVPIVRLLFQHGELFDDVSTRRAAAALMTLAPGLVAFSLVNILARAFYALGDTLTPMRISVFCLVLNAVLALALIWRWRQAGLGAANTISALCNMALLLYALRRKLKHLEWAAFRRSLPALGGAAVAAAAVAWGAAALWNARFGQDHLLARAGEVFVPALLAAAIYVGLCAWLKTGHVDELLALVRARLRRGRPQP
ncbi:MAG: rane protein MviN [Verrucomicrobiota bacterium]|jgi:putative peptidoglycan lipid II flippase